MKIDEENDDDDTIPEEYFDMISSFEDKVAFVEELDELHDVFKTMKYTDVDFKHGLDYRERMSRLAEESEEDDWDDDEQDEDDDEEEEMSGDSYELVKCLRPIPDHVGTVSPDVELYDESRMCLQDNGEIQSVMNNCRGKVEQVLSDHLAVLSLQQEDKKIKVLCSSEDTFLLDITEQFHQFKHFKANNELRFDSAQQVWSLSARQRQESLFSVLREDQEEWTTISQIFGDCSRQLYYAVKTQLRVFTIILFRKWGRSLLPNDKEGGFGCLELGFNDIKESWR